MKYFIISIIITLMFVFFCLAINEIKNYVVKSDKKD